MLQYAEYQGCPAVRHQQRPCLYENVDPLGVIKQRKRWSLRYLIFQFFWTLGNSSWNMIGFSNFVRCVMKTSKYRALKAELQFPLCYYPRNIDYCCFTFCNMLLFIEEFSFSIFVVVLFTVFLSLQITLLYFSILLHHTKCFHSAWLIIYAVISTKML